MEADIYFNGKFIKTLTNPEKFVENFRAKRRRGLLSHQANIGYFKESNEVRINTEHGRTRRPLIIVENGKPRLTEKHLKDLAADRIGIEFLLKNGIIEYLDACEEENAYIALRPEDLTPEHTHLEIDPITIFGIPASLIPYAEYNRGDRINYGAKMAGQAIGIFSINHPIRTDTKSNIFGQPQSPLVRTRGADIIEKYPEGQNIVVAIMSSDGYNLNDAIVINKSSVERGLFRSYYFRTYETEKRRYFGGQEDEITIPEPGTKGYRGDKSYKDLAEDGIINPEASVESDSVLIGKLSPLRFLFGEEFAAEIENKREASVCVRHGEKGVVDEVLISETPDGSQLIKVRVRDERIPEIGDKFASRYGQKGVVSLLLRQEDMPFSADGVTPDILFNPHAIPSRMTIGQLLEMLSSKLGAATGQKIDASAFSHMKEDEIRGFMKKLGFRDDGKQTLYDGRTGRMFEAQIFMGVCYYFKLDHMVTDKIHARSRGPVTLLTKQPTQGRAKLGGLRLGEMEQQCLLGHGAALALKERFDSDITNIPVCQKCGMVAIFDVAKNRAYCPVCKSSEVHWVQTGYAFKLFLDELKSMIIDMKLKTEEL
jgi:DNA-directed RNA polymerase subunit B'